MKLVKITYYRGNKKDTILTAIVKASQVVDIKQLTNIYVIKVEDAPSGCVRDYILK